MYDQQYVVAGACAPATTRSATGKLQRQLFYKGQMLPADTPPTEIQHLLSVNLISPVQVPLRLTREPVVAPSVDGPDTQPSVESPEPDKGDQQPTGTPDPDVEAKRADARAKAEAMLKAGNQPDGRTGQPVLVELLVGKGYGYDALAKEDKGPLLEMWRGLTR